MEKFVYDFDDIYSFCDKMDTTSSNLESELISTRRSVTETKKWEGSANQAFEYSYSEMNKPIVTNIVELKNLSAFIRNAAQCVEETDENLSNLSI